MKAMKKKTYLFLTLIMALMTFSACSDDDDEAVGTQNPEQEVAGTYIGTWNQKLTNSSGELQDENEATGTIELSANRQWVANVTLRQADPVVKEEISDVANCSGNSTSGYILTNNKSANLGNFSAKVTNGEITFIYVTHDQEEALTMSDKIVVLSEGKIQQIGTPEDIYNEPKNAFVADFIGESNIFKGIMTGHMKVRFCGGEFVGMDDVPEGTLVDVVIRPEDVIITKPEDGTVVGEVTSVIFKGMHYEVAVESGKYEMIIRTTRCYHVGDTVGMQLEPDGIHVMIAEDHTTSFVTTINGDYTLDFNGKIISCDLTQVIPKTKMSDGVLVDENGENVDVSKFRVVVSIQPDDIEMSDDVTAGLVSGKIINLIYKGDHYSYVIRTEYGHDLIVDDEYLWNMDDHVGLIMPEEKMKFQLKK